MLILGESAYSWPDGHGGVVNPGADHPTDVVRYWGIEHFGKRGYMTSMGKALCGKKEPTLDEREHAWSEVAFTEFIQVTVGMGAKKRPTARMIREARKGLLPLLEEIRPTKVLVTGMNLWNNFLPGCNGPHLCDDLQAYKLSDGRLVWCLAVPHPSNRMKGQGFPWKRISDAIRTFKAINFPITE